VPINQPRHLFFHAPYSAKIAMPISPLMMLYQGYELFYRYFVDCGFEAFSSSVDTKPLLDSSN
jgi:hypothetical protein